MTLFQTQLILIISLIINIITINWIFALKIKKYL